jgi:hypothetical protein
MENEKVGGRAVLGPYPFTFRIKGKGDEWADELIKRIEASPLSELIQEYLNAVEEVKKNRKLSPEDKLKKLIPPLNKIHRIIFPKFPKYHDVSGLADIIPFIDDKHIDLKKELDFENLRPNHQKYSILGGTELKGFYLDTDRKNIWISEEHELYITYCRDIQPISEAEFERKCEKGEIDTTKVSVTKKPSKWDLIPEERISPNHRHRSISEIWPVWLPTLNQETIKSKDLLNQILVCYTIKRALNGDEKAIEKIYDLYKETAQGIAVKIARKFRLSIKDIKQNAFILLRLLISGFRPESILKQLLVKSEDGAINALPKWVKKFFIHYLSEYVPARLKEIQEKSKVIDRIKGGEVVLGLELMTFLNPFTPIQEATLWIGSPVRINRFNSYSYRPIKMGPRRNLTTWLFGVVDEDPRGSLYRLLRDKCKSEARMKSKEESFDFTDKVDEDHVEILTYEDRKKAIGIEDLGAEEDKLESEIDLKKKMKKLSKGLSDLGAPERNIRIYFQWTTDGLTQSVIAKEFGLSTRQVKRICQQIKDLLPEVKHHLQEG